MPALVERLIDLLPPTPGSDREQEKMDKLQQARETKMKTVARELIETERTTKATQEEMFTARAELTDEQLALERQQNAITNNQMKQTFA